MDKKLHILLIDDQEIFCEGLELLLMQHKKIGIVGIAKNLDETLAYLRPNAITVNIIILDLQFDAKEFHGFTIAKKIKQLYPKIKIIILTGHVRKVHYKRLFEDCKVDGYLDKKLSIEYTYEAIDTVMRGEQFIDPKIISISEGEDMIKTTPREKQIMELLSQGDQHKHIADKLHISTRTVNATVAKLFIKLKVSNGTQLIAKYLKYMGKMRDDSDDAISLFEDKDSN